MGDMANSDFWQIELTLNTNYLGALNVLQAALPLLPKTGAARAPLMPQPQAPDPQLLK